MYKLFKDHNMKREFLFITMTEGSPNNNVMTDERRCLGFELQLLHITMFISVN